MFFLIFIGFFNMYFSPLSTRSQAVFNNPAGLYFNRGQEFFFNFSTESNYRAGFSYNNQGMGFLRESGRTLWHYAVAAGIKNSISGGFLYVTPTNFWRLGLMFRPGRLASFSLIYNKDTTIGAGLAMHPFTNRITIASDATYKHVLTNYRIGIKVLPVYGIELSASIDRQRHLSAGLSLLFENITASFYRRSTKNAGEIRLSKQRFYSVFNRKRAIVWHVRSYPEYRKTNGLFIKRVSHNSFYDLISAFKRIRKDRKIEALVIDLRNESLPFYQKEEVCRELDILKSLGKKIYVYSDNYTMSDYLFAPYADKFILAPSGDVVIKGLYVSEFFLKSALSKLGMTAEMDRIGKYKSAVEPLIRDSMSEPEREQTMKLLKDMWDVWRRQAKSRLTISADSVLKIGYFNSDDALKFGLVDTLIPLHKLRAYIGRFSHNYVNLGTFAKQRYVPYDFTTPSAVVAVLVLDGDIVNGKSSVNPLPIPLLGGRHIGSYSVISVLDKLRQRKDVKAVVIRINSPGGDALASKEMYDAICDLKSVKPVVVSMASVAASGGYYISAPATSIFADKSTVTGSIGILNGKLVIKDFLGKLGINVQTVKIGPHADMFSPYRGWTEKERQGERKELEFGYNAFLKDVASGRNISVDSVNTIAQGRVWSGLMGKNVGIVDTIGGLYDAIAYAAKLAGIGSFRTAYWSDNLGAQHIPDLVRSSEWSGMLYLAPFIKIKDNR